MSDTAKVVLGLGALWLFLPMLRQPMPATSMPAQQPVQPYPTGGVPYPPAQSQYQGGPAYENPAAWGQGLGSLFSGIGNLVNASNGASSSGY